MSAAACLLTEDELLCAICLDVFTLPVTLPCGHNYCRGCIMQQWEASSNCQCPLCQERFDVRPPLRINNSIADMAARFKQTAAIPRSRNSWSVPAMNRDAMYEPINAGSSISNNSSRTRRLISSFNSITSGISDNSGRTGSSASSIYSNGFSYLSSNRSSNINSSVSSIDSNRDSIGDNSNRINSIVSSISSNSQAVSNSGSSISSNRSSNISSSISSIDSNTSGIRDNSGRTGSSVSSLLSNGFSYLSSYSSNISSSISSIDSNTSGIRDNSGRTGSSVSSLLSNGFSYLSSYSSNISSNISSIDSNRGSIGDNSSRINSIVSSISSNRGGVSSNGSRVSSNRGGVSSRPDGSGVASSSNINGSESQHQVAGLGDIPCDECIGTKMKAVKSCLQCLTCYCETHVKPHNTTMVLKAHTLLDPIENLGSRMCSKHKKALELFCKTDNSSICMNCKVLEHEKHTCVSMEEECKHRKGILGQTDFTLHQMIEERRTKIQQLRRAAQLNKETAEGQTVVGNQVITGLQSLLSKGLEKLVQSVEEKLNLTVSLTESLIKELGHEVLKLMQRSADVQQLSGSDDYFLVVQSFSATSNIPAMRNWSEVSVQQPLYELMVRQAVAEAVENLESTFRTEKKKLLEEELRRMHQFEVDLVLDSQTASPWIVLSADGKQAHQSDMKKNLACNAERFYPEGGVLAKQSFQSGRFYFEVQVQGLMRWDLGVVKESVNRRKKVTRSTEASHWILSVRKGSEMRARCSHDIPLSETWNPPRVGVFVDYDLGLVSFYDIEAAKLIYAFSDCSFIERLYPFFNPGQASTNSANLIICPTQCPRIRLGTQPRTCHEPCHSTC
ncbi:E3 ubiquitin-protein ligase TRIM21-like [Cololabis saira]|uniref:E3 ubiquitin-protein ligase TRIM21-like n=1 Tax=Cololabis saira TaxID=129043 RepID=UPI002AD5544B|nr:E3 ubiquitin-protein ligase TRIM21-like [Cololabis saira]